MTTARKTSYINATCPLALTISPTTDGRFTYSVIDYSKAARVLQQTFSTQEQARDAGFDAAEKYAIGAVKDQFAVARGENQRVFED
jgi:hypothetical protein